jgi:hypothetical protein
MTLKYVHYFTSARRHGIVSDDRPEPMHPVHILTETRTAVWPE